MKNENSNKNRRNTKYNKRSAGAKTLERDSKFRPEKDRSVNEDHANDPAWYIPDADMARVVANYPFGHPLGLPVEFDKPADPNASVEDSAGIGGHYALPGIASLRFVPSVGDANTDSDAVNIAAQRLYTQIRMANAGAKNYEPSDLMIYILAMDSLYMAYACGMRAYGLMYTYNPMNRYVPKSLVAASGFDPDDLEGRAADFKAFLDYFGARIGAMCVPNNMSYHIRHAYLCSSVFTDDPTLKAQMYLFKPEVLWQFSAYSNVKGGELIPVDWNAGGKLLTLADYQKKVNSMLKYVVSNIDCAIISGDIAKKFEGNLFSVPRVNIDYTQSLTYDEWMLEQIRNCVPVGDFYWDEDFRSGIRQDVGTVDPITGEEIIGGLRSEIWVKDWSEIDKVMLNTRADLVDPARFIEMTRLIAATPHNGQNSGEDPVRLSRVMHSGSEFVTSVDVYCEPWYEDFEGSAHYVQPYNYTYRMEAGSTVERLTSQLHDMAIVSNFDFFPQLQYMKNNEIVAHVGSLDNFTMFETSRMQGINNVVFLRMFGIL